ncbi:hypothetical protein EB796_018664 [Bugula neritina]|uniref:Uncharacterized protein n=1 Tax=Bugula neritina TaxID=10212 RepID=A0A7J7J9X0_BUGNE|nr:hypothetical protein EB796_018664 [Bugula neritina]
MYSRDIYVERACSVECKEASVLKMANIKNLFCFFLTLITCRAQTQSWENTKSRLQITLIHLDSKALNASYIKVKNNPHYNCLYNVTVDSIPGAGVEKGSHAYQMNVYHQETGVGVIPIQWPNAAVGTEANITVVEVPQSSEMLPASLRVSDVGMSDFCKYAPILSVYVGF